jgi:hypothetical protein
MTVMLDQNIFAQCDMKDFEPVIAKGEPFLSHAQDPRTRARALFAVADAYADIVVLATGDPHGYGDTTEFVPRAPAARRKAIQYYREALTLDRTSAQARAAWLQAWRLIAGVAPSRTRFYCIND